MKRKHLILLPAFAAALAAWVGAGYYLHRMETFRGCLNILDLILLAHLLLWRLDRLSDRLQAWPAGEKGLRLQPRARREKAAPEEAPPAAEPKAADPRTRWLEQLEREERAAAPAPAPRPIQDAPPAPAAGWDPAGSYAELIEPERLQLGLPPRLRPSSRRSALQIIAGKGTWGLAVAEHWLGQPRRGSDLINQHLPALFRMGQLSPGGLYCIHSDGMRPAVLSLTADGRLEVVEKGSLTVERC